MDRRASRPRTVQTSPVRKGDPCAPRTHQPRAPRPGLLSGAEPSLPQRLRACTGQSPQRQGLETWAGAYGPRDPREGPLCGSVSFQGRRWEPPAACSRVPLQAGGPDVVTWPHPAQRAPSWPGRLTGRCPGDAWLRQARGPDLATLCCRPCVSGGPPQTLREPGSQCRPHHPRRLSTFSPDETVDVPGLRQPREFGPYRGSAVGPPWGPSSQLCPLTWVAGMSSTPSIPQLSGAVPGRG